MSKVAPRLRQLMRSVAQPVAVVTCCLPPSTVPNHGATLSSLSSISLSPPLVAFSLRLPSTLASFLEPTRGGSTGAVTMSSSASVPLPPPQRRAQFSVHLLSGAQEQVARAFARQAPLPQKALPSSVPDTPPQEGATNDHFPLELFDQLRERSLGELRCSILRTMPLWELSDKGKPADGEEEAVRSQLFIARVEEVTLPEDGREDEGSLVYSGQEYAVVRPSA